jgi:hypothetical protein
MSIRIKLTACRFNLKFKENPLINSQNFLQHTVHFKDEEVLILEFEEEILVNQQQFKATLIFPKYGNLTKELMIIYYGPGVNPKELTFGVESKDPSIYSFHFVSDLQFETQSK